MCPITYAYHMYIYRCQRRFNLKWGCVGLLFEKSLKL